MSDVKDNENFDDANQRQISAIGLVYEAVKSLTPEAAHSVLAYVNGMISPKLKLQSGARNFSSEFDSPEVANNDGGQNTAALLDDHAYEGVHDVAKKWVRRNGFVDSDLSKLFSFGLDEIDLVVSKVPGSSEQQRLRSVFLLKGVAAYLASGQARFTHEQVKQACEHYSAWNKTNTSTYIKGLSASVGGTAASGYTLTARGLSEAAELIKTMIS